MRFIILFILILIGYFNSDLPIRAIFSPREPVSLLELFMPDLGYSRKRLIVALLDVGYVLFFVNKILRWNQRMTLLFLVKGILLQN